MKKPSKAYRDWSKRQERLAKKAREYERDVAKIKAETKPPKPPAAAAGRA